MKSAPGSFISGASVFAVSKLVDVGLIAPPLDLSNYKRFFLQQPASWKSGDEALGIYTDQMKFCNAVVLNVFDRDRKTPLVMIGWHVSHQKECFKHFQGSFLETLTSYEELYPEDKFYRSARIFSRYNVSLDRNYRENPNAAIEVGDAQEMSSAIFSKISGFLKDKVRQRFEVINSPTLVIDQSGRNLRIPLSQEWSKKFNNNDSSPGR